MNKIFRSLAGALLVAGLTWGLYYPIGGSFSLGVLLDPVDGLYRTAVKAEDYGSVTPSISGMESPVRLIRDERGVPHIFAENDRDATRAFGYAVAQDRLFELDFIPRAASGRLSEVMGPSAIETDRFFRDTGMAWATRRQIAWLKRTNSIQLKIINWYLEGVNAWIDTLEPEDYPLEFRLLNYAPSHMSASDALLVLQYMTFDLTYRARDRAFSTLIDELGREEFDHLFPRFPTYFKPIIPPDEDFWSRSDLNALKNQKTGGDRPETLSRGPMAPDRGAARISRRGTISEGFIFGKGSNNWAVDGAHSVTGYPILSGDMHLNLSLPAIWYEAHLVTPEMNVYGVTIPGAPVIVEGITPTTAWAFTNTGSDQIDYYALQTDSTGTSYSVDGRLLPFNMQSDTIRVAGQDAIIEQRYYSRFGPVTFDDEGATATRWVAHDSVRTLQAIWEMGHATNHTAFENATRIWDAPMQNILFADHEGTIAIRSTGYLPLRKNERTGEAVLDGTNTDSDWIGRVPFDELPAVSNPERGYLTSTNQQPTDRTYPYYLGWDWRDAYRSIRIDSLLRSKDTHTVDDLKSYQADIHPVQADLFIPVINSVDGLSDAAAQIREVLASWDRMASIDQIAPTFLHAFIDELKGLTWDEDVFRLARPSDTRTLSLILNDPGSKWFDRTKTDVKESAADIVRESIERVAARFSDEYASSSDALIWGRQHRLVVKHITRSPALKALWRGPFPFPGFRQTLSPGDALTSTASASWRVVVDFSTIPTTAFGVYPGGQSGNPFSDRYDYQMRSYLDFEYYRLLNVDSDEDIPVDSRRSDLVFSAR